MGWADEDELVLVSIVASIIMLVSLDFYLGVIYSFLIFSYALVSRKPWAIQFSIDKKYINPSLIVVGIIMTIAWIFISANVSGINMQSIISNFSLMALSPTQIFKTSNPILRFVIWCIFIPLAETLFVFGVVYGYAKYKTRDPIIAGGITILCLVILHTINATMLPSHEMTNSVMIIDSLFVIASIGLIENKKQLKEAFYFHAVANTLRTLSVLGYLVMFGA